MTRTIYFDPALGNALQRYADAYEARKQREAEKTAQETARRLGERETDEHHKEANDHERAFETSRRA